MRLRYIIPHIRWRLSRITRAKIADSIRRKLARRAYARLDAMNDAAYTMELLFNGATVGVGSVRVRKPGHKALVDPSATKFLHGDFQRKVRLALAMNESMLPVLEMIERMKPDSSNSALVGLKDYVGSLVVMEG